MRWIFEAFAEQGKGETEIARLLNERGVDLESGTPWTNNRIRCMLQNENYIGNLVYARFSCKLRTKAVRNASEQWIRKEGAFKGIVPAAQRSGSQRRVAAAHAHRSPQPGGPGAGRADS